MSQAASQELLQEIHSRLTAALLDYLKTTPPARRKAVWMDVIRAFLKDNHVSNLDEMGALEVMTRTQQDIERLPFQDSSKLSQPF